MSEQQQQQHPVGSISGSGKLLGPYGSAKNIVVAVGNRISVPRHHEVITGIPEGMTAEQAAVQAEVDPVALKSALRRDHRRSQIKYMATDTFETDGACAFAAALLIGGFAVPLTKFAVDHASINRTYYTEKMVGQNTFVVTPNRAPAGTSAAGATGLNQAHAASALKNSAKSVAGSTFQSIVASGNIVPLMNAMEKLRAQQLRLGFFSIWRGTGAEIFWFVLSCGTVIAAEALVDRHWNRDWYRALADRKATLKKQNDEKRSGLVGNAAATGGGPHISTSTAVEEAEKKTTNKSGISGYLLGGSGSNNFSSDDSDQQKKTSSGNKSSSEFAQLAARVSPRFSPSDNSNSRTDSSSNSDNLQDDAVSSINSSSSSSSSSLLTAESEKLRFERQVPYGAQPDLDPGHLSHLVYSAKRNAIEHALCGAAGGGLAVLTTYHAEVVATKCVEDYQASVKTAARRQYSSMIDCYLKTHQQHGLTSLYVGVGPVFLRAAAFWSLTFGLRNGLLSLWGFVSSSDYVRIMKRLHFDLAGVDRVSEERRSAPSSSAGAVVVVDRAWKQKKFLSSGIGIEFMHFETVEDKKGGSTLQLVQNPIGSKDGKQQQRTRLQRFYEVFAGRSFDYAGTTFYCPPFLINFVFGCGAAAIARDAGVHLVRQGVLYKSAVGHVFRTLVGRAQASSSSSAEAAAAGAAELDMKVLWKEAMAYGRTAASLVPSRLPFSVVRTGLVMALFDSIRMAHTKRWCIQQHTARAQHEHQQKQAQAGKAKK